jgi:hypothetical protein
VRWYDGSITTIIEPSVTSERLLARVLVEHRRAGDGLAGRRILDLAVDRTFIGVRDRRCDDEHERAQREQELLHGGS